MWLWLLDLLQWMVTQQETVGSTGGFKKKEDMKLGTMEVRMGLGGDREELG